MHPPGKRAVRPELWWKLQTGITYDMPLASDITGPCTMCGISLHLPLTRHMGLARIAACMQLHDF